MTVSEIYSGIISHMIKGMMMHENLANYYDFLGLGGYKKCHEYHFMEETANFRKLTSYYICHHNNLIPDTDITPVQVIPDSWYQVDRFDVDIATKKSAVKTGLTIWHRWEKETQQLYEQMYQEMMNGGYVADALNFKKYVCDVTEELKKVEKYMLNKLAVDFDLAYIMEEQKPKKEKYKCKLKDIGDRYD